MGVLNKKKKGSSVENSTTRKYTKPMFYIISFISVFWALFQIYFSSIGVMTAIEARAWYLGFLVIMIFLLYPAGRKKKEQMNMPTVWDIICIIAGLLSVGYLVLNLDAFINRGGLHVPLDYWFGGIGILVVFEAARRTTGKALVIISTIFMVYSFFGYLIPGILGHQGFSLQRIIDVMWWHTQGVFGEVLGAAVNYIFVFVIFGAFLRKGGFINFVNDFSLAIAGKSSGGPAKVSVIASGLMGMVSGSGAANVATTGTVTIPLMERTGFKKYFAAGVESVASTGGMIAPPVMGAAAFIMAEFISVPYRDIILAALIPALLYYVMCFSSVHFEAKKLNLRGLPKESLPNALKVFKENGHMILPLVVLVGLIIFGMTPLYAVVWAILTTVVTSWFKKDTRMGIKDILKALEEGVKGSLTVSAACAIAGLIVGTISLTSVGLVIGNNILSIAGNQLILVALLTMTLSIVLGMGVPPSASYIITAIVAAPYLVEMGVPLLVAHMFAFYFAALSDITPPVALASLTASGIANESFTKVAISSVRIGAIGFLIPFFFLYNPLLLFEGDNIVASIIAGITAMIGVISFAASLSNWFLTKTGIIQRTLLAVAGFLMIFPGYITDFMGCIIIIFVIVWQKRGLMSTVV